MTATRQIAGESRRAIWVLRPEYTKKTGSKNVVVSGSR
jgi:hypothetical protein